MDSKERKRLAVKDVKEWAAQQGFAIDDRTAEDVLERMMRITENETIKGKAVPPRPLPDPANGRIDGPGDRTVMPG